MTTNLPVSEPPAVEKKAGCKCGNRCSKLKSHPGHAHPDAKGCANHAHPHDKQVEAAPRIADAMPA